MFRLRKIATLISMSLMMFAVLGMEAEAQVTYYWTGANGSNWTDPLNWDPSTSATGPGAADYAVFDGRTNVIAIVNAATTVKRLIVSVDDVANPAYYTTQYIRMTSELAVTESVSIGHASATVNNLNLISSGGSLTITSTATLSLLSRAHVVGAATVKMDGKITAASDLTPSLGSSIKLRIRNKDCLLSDLVTYGVIDLGFIGSGNKQISLVLGTHNLYLGSTARIDSATSDVGATDGFIKTQSGDCVPGAGRLCREVKAASGLNTLNNGYFIFPVGEVGERFTPIRLAVCLSGTLNNSVVPFPYVSVRAAANWGTLKGHPDNQQSAKVGVYWPVKGEGLPFDVDPISGDTLGVLFGFSGLMEFSNIYRDAQPDSLFSAMYKTHIEDDALCSTGGPYGGYWELTGSQTVKELTGSYRSIPFGQYAPTNGYDNTKDCMPGYGDISGGVSSGGAIPVELTSFSARYYDGSVRLDWQTATELNNHGFYVERSLDGESWEDIRFIEGAGTSNVPLSYSYTDILERSLLELPQIAYRLRQEDRDGTIDYSGIVYAYTGVQPDRVELYDAYPNPFNPSTTLSFSLQEPAYVTLKVYNTFGQAVATVRSGNFDAGFHTVEFQGADLPSGVYIAVLDAAGSVQQQKLVLSK